MYKYCDNQKKGNAIASAFRAINLANQNVSADTVKVLFPLEQFDLANEYNLVNSRFIPKEAGVYSIIGAISFSPNNLNIDYRARIEIGDRVEIFAESSVDGTILTDTDGVISTHFEAARFPSPTR